LNQGIPLRVFQFDILKTNRRKNKTMIAINNWTTKGGRKKALAWQSRDWRRSRVCPKERGEGNEGRERRVHRATVEERERSSAYRREGCYASGWYRPRIALAWKKARAQSQPFQEKERERRGAGEGEHERERESVTAPSASREEEESPLVLGRRQSIVTSTRNGLSRRSLLDPEKTSGVLVESAGLGVYNNAVIPTPASVRTSGSAVLSGAISSAESSIPHSPRWKSSSSLRDGEKRRAGGPRRRGSAGEVYRDDKNAISGPLFINVYACARLFSSPLSAPLPFRSISFSPFDLVAVAIKDESEVFLEDTRASSESTMPRSGH